MESKRWIFNILIAVPVILSLMMYKIEVEDIDFSVFLQSDGAYGVSPASGGLEYDFYRKSCPRAESSVRSSVSYLYAKHEDSYAALLRLFFHDCFIQGCDASIFLDDSYGNKSYLTERQAAPSKTLRGFDNVDFIKAELEKICPRVVSCADTLALATRDSIVLAGGPFYPVFTGRRDSARSFYHRAMTEIPSPFDNIERILDLFSNRGFDEKETVSLLGGHNVGKMSCKFIQSRLYNFSGTGKPDPSMAYDLQHQLRLKCQEHKGASQFSLIASGSTFNAHYYRNLLLGKGLLFADQQLMADERTARFVREYASDDGTTFRRDFARAMLKMSNLGVLTGTQGQIRTKCSSPAI